MINGRKLRQLREGADLTAAQLGDTVGVSQSMIAHMERGLKTPSLEVMARIADYFGVPIDDLRKKDHSA